MKLKKFTSFILTLTLIFSMSFTKVFATENDSKNLEQAIEKAKSIVNIPESYTTFSHSIIHDDTTTKLLELNWAEKGGKQGNISVSIDTNGNLYNYYKSCNEDALTGISQITKGQAQHSAEEFLSKALPSYANSMKKVNTHDNDTSNNNYSFTYKQFVNDLPTDFIVVNINVNKYTNEVILFNFSKPDKSNFEYPSVDNIINYEQAKKDYIEKIGLNLKYHSYYDYKQNKLNIFPAYSIDNINNLAINANSGDIIYKNNINPLYREGKTNNINETLDTLTKEENDAIKDISGIITKEEAENILKKYLPNINLTNSYLNKNNISNQYVWQMMSDNAYGEIDAKSGELLAFNSYSNDNLQNKNLSKDEAKNIAEKFLKEVATNKFSETKYDTTTDLMLDNTSNDIKQYSFDFIRQVNGIAFVDNFLRVVIDKDTGNIIQYNNVWYDNVTFPDINNAINKEAAFDKINANQNFGLKYIINNKNEIYLAYDFIDLSGFYLIDPINGNRLDFNGDIYKDFKIPQYTDINRHWCEKTIKHLLDNGYYLKGEKFNPDNNITQINFLRYLYSPTQNFYNDDEFYDMLINTNILKEEEKSPNSLLTNEEIAKLIVRYLKYEKIALHSKVFVNPFKDEIDENFKGYAAICFALNIMNGDNEGKFNPKNNVTNAEAAQIIYNLLIQN